jgi:hypothetical protein
MEGNIAISPMGRLSLLDTIYRSTSQFISEPGFRNRQKWPDGEKWSFFFQGFVQGETHKQKLS